MNIVRLSYTWRVSFGLNNICLSCSRFVSVLFVVLVKIELDNVVKENYSSQICWSKNCSLRVFGSSTNDRLQISWRGDLELDNEKRLQFINSYTVWATAEKINYSMTICYYLLCGEHSRSKMIFLEKTYHGKVVIWQMAGKTIKITVASIGIWINIC